MDWANIFADVGVMAGIVIFFIWTAWKREERLSTRITRLEQFVEEQLIQVLDQANNHLKLNSTALEKHTLAIERLIEKMGYSNEGGRSH